MKAVVKRRHLFILPILSLLAINCSQPYTVEEQRTAQILQTLSADELKGRYALSPEIKIAEDYIKSEFEKAGLEPVSDNNFEQTFTITESIIENSRVEISGLLVDESLYFAFTVDENFESTSESTTVYQITETNDFRSDFNRLRESSDDVIVLVHPNFEELFNRYQAYYQREHRFLTESSQGNVIFILSDAVDEEIHVQFNSQLTTKICLM